ncbi:hypothetical protein BM221_001690 [Beauveria bassiana]|uniref:Uncharacterized protein n=1 Tax=Beauveria bassiana TaxID=176275 RepID=A0A2N6NWF8_BEABA|nr:hypothetical protein BM221_001690 [Beauveria bassiana]
MADHNHDASTPCSSTTSTTSLDRKTQPVVVQLTRVAAAAAASSTQAAGDFSSYLALKSPLFVDLEGDFGGSYSRHASLAESDSDMHGAEDDSGRGGGMATATRIRHRRRTRTRTRKIRSIWRRRKQRLYKYQKNAQAIAQAVGQYADDDERACASRVDTTAAIPV